MGKAFFDECFPSVSSPLRVEKLSFLDPPSKSGDDDGYKKTSVTSVVKKNASRRGRKESAETAEGFYPSARHPLTAQQSKGIQKKVRLNHEEREIHERISEAQKNFVHFEIFVNFVVKKNASRRGRKDFSSPVIPANAGIQKKL